MYYFTFPQRITWLKDRYVALDGTFAEARTRMVEAYGTAWAFQYAETDFAGKPERFGLREISLAEACELRPEGS